MFRTIFWLLMTILGITLLRAVIGAVAKMLFGGSASSASTPQKRPDQVPSGGVLRKDPVCGVFVSEAVSLKLKQGGEVLHFCSQKCKDEYSSRSPA